MDDPLLLGSGDRMGRAVDSGQVLLDRGGQIKGAPATSLQHRRMRENLTEIQSGSEGGRAGTMIIVTITTLTRIITGIAGITK